MIIRQLKTSHFENLQNHLQEIGHREPLSACSTARLTVNDSTYIIKLQPERHCKMAVLQAVRMEQKKNGLAYTLITKGSLLISLLDLLVDQASA